MSGFLASFSNSRGWRKISNNVFSPFGRSFLFYGQWFAGTLFNRELIRSSPNTGNQGWQHIAGFLGVLLPLALAIVPGIPLAIFWHSLGGFLDAVYVTGRKSWHWATGYQSEPGEAGNLDNKPERNNLQKIFAAPGYVFSIPLCLAIFLSLASFKIISPLVRGLWSQIIKPFFQGLGDAFAKSMEGLFGIKKEENPFKGLGFRENQGNIQKLAFGLGALGGIMIAAPFGFLALAWHSLMGFVDTLTWGIPTIWSLGKSEKGFFASQSLKRYPGQHILAMPGYILGLGVSVIVVLPIKIIYEGITRVVMPLIKGVWNQIISPFFQGLGKAFASSLEGLFREKEAGVSLGESLKFIPEHNTFQRFIFSVGALAGLVAAVPFSIVALAWHSVIGFFETVVWGSRRIWEEDYKENLMSPKSQALNRYSGQHVLAAPGYLLGLAVCIPIAMVKILVDITTPFFRGLGDAFTKSLEALFGEKTEGVDFKWLKFNEAYKNSNIKKFRSFLGFLPGIVLAIPFGPVAVAWHSIIGLFEALTWGSSKIWGGENGKKNFFDTEVQFLKRYPGQHILAAPGYALGLAISLPLGVLSRVVFEIGAQVIVPLARGVWNQVISPFFQGIGSAFIKSLEGLFTEKKAEVGFEGLKFIEGHNAFQKLLFSMGALAGLVAAAPFSIVALAWHSVIGFFETVVWGSRRIWEKEYNEEFLKVTEKRYLGEHLLAAPGYVLGLMVCVPIGIAKGVFEIVIRILRGLWTQIIKPFFQGIGDAFAKSMGALFDIKKGVPFKGLKFRENQGKIQKLTFGLGALVGIMIAAPFSLLAFAWHSLSGFYQALSYGTEYMWSKQRPGENFSKRTQTRYFGQRLLAAPGYALGFLACIIPLPFCLINRYRSEIRKVLEIALKVVVGSLMFVIVSSAKSALLVAWNLLAFLGNVITFEFKAAGASLEKAWVHVLGLVSLGILDALWRSVFGGPQLVGMRSAEAGNTEQEKMVKIAKIYNALDIQGALPHNKPSEDQPGQAQGDALDLDLLRNGRETPTFSHVLERRVLKSTDFGLDSSVERALKRITEEFKCEERASGKPSNFFAIKQHIAIIDSMLAERGNDKSDREGLEDLKVALEAVLDDGAGRRIKISNQK